MWLYCLPFRLFFPYESVTSASSTPFRKVKEAWDNKRDMLVKSGSFAIEQLSEALSTKGSLDKLPDDLPQYALSLCAEQVIVCSILCIVLVDQ